MKLDEWLTEHGLTNKEFGRRIGRSGEAVRRYRGHLRTPDMGTMPLIFRATGGQVQPNDFYNLTALE